jgi:23S rRNA (adenine2030-N6)-methyltransferase
MLSYKHGFHAGNHADVLKHICLIYFIKSIKNTYNSIIYVDTHAGGGLYNLKHEYMKKNKEYLTGISKIINFKTNDPYIRYYLKTIKNINASSLIKFYPGSPKISEFLTDLKDELYFCELHNNEYQVLKNNFKKNINIKIIKKDGFNIFDNRKIKQEKKGIILIDPSYEIKEDYEKVIDFINNNYTKFNNKIILIWYPLINRDETKKYIDQFKKTGIRDILRIEMPIMNDKEDKGMTGSGLMAINTHKKTAQNLRGTIKELQSCLQINDNKKRVFVNYLR